jgi:hypothetical protein
MFEQAFTGSIARIANNDDCLYDGALRRYFKLVFAAPNIHHGYHGLRHMLHVTWVCYEACVYYEKVGKLDNRRRRNLLIAALFHDFEHAGKPVDDSLNIRAAIEALKQFLLPEDKPFEMDIISILVVTQFPQLDFGEKLTLEQAIIRDADMSQVFGPTWIGDIVAGLGNELGKSPKEMLEQQYKFLNGLKFHSEFGEVFFGDQAVKAKIAETRALIDILS